MKFAARCFAGVFVPLFLVVLYNSEAAPNVDGAASEYLDSAVCATCHGEIAKSYNLTGMARSAYRPSSENMRANMPEDYARNNSIYHAPSDRYYTMLQRNGKFYQRRHQIGFGGKETNVLEEPVDFVIGSGNHARTYLRRTPDGTLAELPISWYSEKGGYWAMSPGYDRPDQEEFRRAIPNDCVFCHNAYPLLPKASLPTDKTASLNDSVQNGIGCQRCHGPGRDHVAAASSGHGTADSIRRAIVNPARLTRDRQLDVCNQCHLETTSSPLPGAIRRYDRDVFSYRPGQPLAEYRIDFVRAQEKDQTDRFEIAHSAYRLQKSACFQQSQMTCTTCHNPHQVPRGERAVAHYVAACRSCHQTVHSSETLVGTCMDCHMPKRRAEDAVHVIMTDHFIQRQKPARDLLAPLEESALNSTKYQGPVELYNPDSLRNSPDRDLYLAVAQVIDRSNLQAGIPQLTHAIEKYSPSQPEFTFELGKAYEKTNDHVAAIRTFEQYLHRLPNSREAQRELVATLFANGETQRAVKVIQDSLSHGKPDAILLTNRGNAYLQQNKLALAGQSLEHALQLDPELPEPNNLLGMVHVRQDDKRAERYFREAIRLEPEFAAAHNNLATFLVGTGDYPQAAYHFEKAIAADPSYAEAHHGYGLLLELTHSYDKAASEFQEAVKINPEFALAHSDLADLLAAGHHAQDAAEQYRLALRSQPQLVEALYGLASILATAGNIAEAESHLLRALKIKSDYYEAHLLLAKILSANGKSAEAKIHFQKAAESPDSDLRDAARKELR